MSDIEIWQIVGVLINGAWLLLSVYVMFAVIKLKTIVVASLEFLKQEAYKQDNIRAYESIRNSKKSD